MFVFVQQHIWSNKSNVFGMIKKLQVYYCLKHLTHRPSTPSFLPSILNSIVQNVGKYAYCLLSESETLDLEARHGQLENWKQRKKLELELLLGKLQMGTMSVKHHLKSNHHIEGQRLNVVELVLAGGQQYSAAILDKSTTKEKTRGFVTLVSPKTYRKIGCSQLKQGFKMLGF